MRDLRIKKLVLVAVVLLALVGGASLSAAGPTAMGADDDDSYSIGRPGLIPSRPARMFSPANTRTKDGQFIPVADFFPASRCVGCHADTHASWSQSLHRNAAREPFYRESVDILLKSRGVEFTRHCEACHTPIALVSGALVEGGGHSAPPFTQLDDEGVTCSVCHSITEARLDGTGSYTIRRPALMARPDGTPMFGDFTDQQILADVPSHKRAVMRPLLKTPEFCATCHKVDIPPELNGYKHFRGFSVYDEYQQSGASLETVGPYYRRESRADCRTCHMPKVDSLNDRAAKNGMIASHRWLGANTATPLFYGQTEQVAAIERFLESNVLDVDVFAVKRESTGEQIAPVDQKASEISLTPGETITAEVVVSNRGAAHSFPPEVRDLYEAWVEFEVVDQDGRSVFHSGFIKPDGMLDPSAHVYKSILVDPSARVITRHQIWLTTIKAFDSAIPAGRSDLVRFRFKAPEHTGQQGPITLRLRARVNYRRFNQEYADYVLKRRDSSVSVPIVKMAEADQFIGPEAPRPEPSQQQYTPGTGAGPGTVASGAIVGKTIAGRIPLAKRWNDYGIALMEQAQYGPAADAFLKASELNPLDPNPLVSAGVATLKTERFGEERVQLSRAGALINRAIKVDPANARTRFHLAWVLRAECKNEEAAKLWAKLAAEYPRDREVQRQLGQTLFLLGDIQGARAAFEAVLAVDPQDANAYQFLASIYAALGRKADSDRAMSLYHHWRDDPLAAGVAARFYQAHPEWGDERIPSHIHGEGSAQRPVLKGHSASPY